MHLFNITYIEDVYHSVKVYLISHFVRKSLCFFFHFVFFSCALSYILAFFLTENMKFIQCGLMLWVNICNFHYKCILCCCVMGQFNHQTRPLSHWSNHQKHVEQVVNVTRKSTQYGLIVNFRERSLFMGGGRINFSASKLRGGQNFSAQTFGGQPEATKIYPQIFAAEYISM